jgi:antirestriction protein ArdC
MSFISHRSARRARRRVSCAIPSPAISGINVVMLTIAWMEHGFRTQNWLIFR